MGKDFDVRTFDRATDRLGRDMQETVDRLMEAAGRAVAKGMGLVEGQEPVQPSQEHLHAAELSSPSSPPKVDGQPSSPKAGDGTRTEKGPRGVLHEVVYNAVWIRKEASVDSAKIAVKKQGEFVEL